MKIPLSLFAVLISVGAMAQVTFDNATLPPGNGSPSSMVVGDFDGNGRQDVVVNTMPFSITKVFYTESLTQQTENYVKLPDGFTGRANMTVGDVNGDGKDDVVSTHEQNPTMLIWISTGRGFNISSVSLPVSPHIARTDVVDFDNDGKADVIVVMPFTSVYFYKGDGMGHFTAHQLPINPFVSLQYVYFQFAADDFNNDGRADVVIQVGDQVLSYWKNADDSYTLRTNKLTTHPNSTPATVEWPVINIQVGDFNHDSRKDLLLTTSTDDGSGGRQWLSFLANNGDATFADGVDIEIPAGWIRGMDHADFDKDGYEDLVLGSQQWDGSMNVLRNTGDVHFTSYSPDHSSPSATDVRFIDLDGTDSPEIAVMETGGSIEYFQWNGSKWLRVARKIFGTSNIEATVYDLDNDGFKDIVSANTGSGAIDIWYGKGNMEYDEPLHIATVTVPWTVSVADFNNDGYGDIVYKLQLDNRVANTYSNWIIRSAGKRSFASPVNVGTASTQSQFLPAADFDRDGDIDFATSRECFLNDGTGNFASSVYSTLDMRGEGNLGDFNNDGFVDFALISNSPHAILYIFQNDGKGKFTLKKQLQADDGLYRIVVADFNHDQFDDIVKLNVAFGSPSPQDFTLIALLTNNHDGTFTESTLALPSTAYGAVAGTSEDINSDGLLDLVVTYEDQSSSNSRVAIFTGLPAGGFDDAQIFMPSTRLSSTPLYNVDVFLFSILLADMDNDSKADLITIGPAGISIAIFRNTSIILPAGSSRDLTVVPTNTQATISLRKGSGNGRIIIVGKPSDPLLLPSDGTFYNPDKTYGNGDKVGDGYTVMRSDLASVVVDGLTPDTDYIVYVFEYFTDNGSTINYMDVGPSAQFKTLPVIEKPSRPLRIDVVPGETTADITVQRSNGNGRLILISKDGDPISLPADLTTYQADKTFGLGDKLGLAYVVMSSNGSTVTVEGLSEATKYIVIAYEYITDNKTVILYSDSITKPFITKPPRVPQTIRFYNTPNHTLTAVASSGLNVELSVISGSGLVDGPTFTPTALGAIALRALQRGNDRYKPVSKDTTFTVLTIPLKLQTITFNKIAAIIYGESNNDFTVTASSGLRVALTLVSGGGTVNGNRYSPGAAGKVTLHAQQPGNSQYKSVEVDLTFCVYPPKPEIIVSYSPSLLLTSSSDIGNTWYKNNEVIVTAKGKTFAPTVAADVYKVSVNIDGCINVSDPRDLAITGIDESTKRITISPNPATTSTIIFGATSEPEFYNMLGARFELPITKRERSFDVNTTSLSPGLYIVKVGNTSLKLVKN